MSAEYRLKCGHPYAPPPAPGPSSIALDPCIAFSPVYSAYDGEHAFKVPVRLDRFSEEPYEVHWDTDRRDLVDIEPVDADTVMLTTKGAGEARIIVRAGPFSGATTLVITAFAPEERILGEEIYAKGVMPKIENRPGSGLTLPDDLTCRGCHVGPKALGREYTPQQTGGFSDERLTALVTTGALPEPTGYPNGPPRWLWVQAHTWPDPTEREQRGLVAYLRSIPPVSYGFVDFGNANLPEM